MEGGGKPRKTFRRLKNSDRVYIPVYVIGCSEGPKKGKHVFEKIKLVTTYLKNKTLQRCYIDPGLETNFKYRLKT